jgi:uncharacterized protein
MRPYRDAMAAFPPQPVPVAARHEDEPALRLALQDWSRVDAELDRDGVAVLPALLSPADCSGLTGLYDTGGPRTFRSKVVMARHGFGQGEYKYFDYPLPEVLSRLRTALYGRLVATANRWNAMLGLEPSFPPSHAEYLQRCHAAGQTRATPLMLRYAAGDFNCLHQDLYGAVAFPLQAVILLSAPGDEFEGGELVLTEQRPRMQSRPQVVPLRQGDAAVFAVSHRPVKGSRGFRRVNMRHGVSRIRSGTRTTVGLIFHDAA